MVNREAKDSLADSWEDCEIRECLVYSSDMPSNQ